MENIKIRPHGDKYFVKPHSNGWAVACKRSSIVSYFYDEKDKAINTAKSLAIENHADVDIQNSDGSIEITLSFR